ncbi:MAG: DHHA1 domain-containing protein [Thermoplasmatota archaeon]
MLIPFFGQIKLKSRANDIAEKLVEAKKVLIVSHIDTDGITSASIAYKSLSRKGIECDVKFVKQLEKDTITQLKNQDHEMIWFTDFGSGQLNELNGLNCVITDHHVPQGNLGAPPRDQRGNLLNYGCSKILELNPHRYGIDGANELCGAGTTYLVAKELGDNVDLTKLAVIGAVGDLQISKEGKLIGKNREILKEGLAAGYIEKRIDAQLYGLESRPLYKVLEYASDPILPGLTGDKNACINFLVEQDIPLKEEDEWRRWYHLSKEEKRRILSGIANRLLETGYPAEYVESLVGEVYTFPDEETGSMLHQAKEFSTLLNSCGRYKKGEIGLKVCLGDRGEYLKKALQLLKGHQKVLVDCLKYVKRDGITERDFIQYFHGKDKIPDTVLGTVAGMILGSGDVDRSLPIIGLTESSEKDGLKVSSRGTKKLIKRGLDLSLIMSKCSEYVGGEGGGHDIAAGAYIPEGAEKKFLDKAEKMIEQQLE